jgi:uncharacterized phage protein (TIGR01671 family)
MTREIKFRAWDKEERVMTHFNLGDLAYNSDTGTYAPDGDWDKCFSADKLLENVMQYTGLKDKNGKEIYEGDIVTVRLGGRLVNQDGVWNEEEDIKGTLVVEMKGLWWSIAPHWDEELAVIGNVFENPDLLEVKNHE